MCECVGNVERGLRPDVYPPIDVLRAPPYLAKQQQQQQHIEAVTPWDAAMAFPGLRATLAWPCACREAAWPCVADEMAFFPMPPPFGVWVWTSRALFLGWCDASVHGRTGTLFMANARLSRTQVAEGEGARACLQPHPQDQDKTMQRTAHARLQADHTAPCPRCRPWRGSHSDAMAARPRHAAMTWQGAVSSVSWRIIQAPAPVSRHGVCVYSVAGPRRAAHRRRWWWWWCGSHCLGGQGATSRSWRGSSPQFTAPLCMR